MGQSDAISRSSGERQLLRGLFGGYRTICDRAQITVTLGGQRVGLMPRPVRLLIHARRRTHLMNETTLRIFVALLALPLAAPAAFHATDKPNILLILADDLGYGDVSCYNDRAKVPTPNLDRLAREGMRFTDAHSPATVCTPTRYSLMTGQMAFRVPNGGTVFTGVGGPSLIAPGRLTLPAMLRAHGYATACVGKWHVGMTFFDKDGAARARQRHRGGAARGLLAPHRRRTGGSRLRPLLRHGLLSHDGLALRVHRRRPRAGSACRAQLDKTLLPKHPYANDCRAGLIATDFPMEEIDLVFLKKSREFLESHVRSTPGKPFFLYHAAQAVHLPSFPADQFKGKTKAGPHGDFIHELDYVVGELLATLDKLGVADNTLVIFTSDNGPETTSVIHMRADYGHDGARPWRGMKRDQWEGGHRVPFLVRWPGQVKPGTTSAQLTSLTDVMATVAAIIGADLPKDAAEDSFNLLPALLGKDSGPIRPYLLQQAFGGSRTLSIRRGQLEIPRPPRLRRQPLRQQSRSQAVHAPRHRARCAGPALQPRSRPRRDDGTSTSSNRRS